MTDIENTEYSPMTQQPTPVLSLRDVVVYPHMVIPLFVGRDRSIQALDKAMDGDKRIVLVTQRSAEVDDPAEDDLFSVGTLATVLQLLKLPDGTTKVLVEGGERALIDRFNVEDHFSAEITPLVDEDRHDEREIDVLVRSIIAQFERDLISERVKSGLAAARARGKKLGRQPGQRPVRRVFIELRERDLHLHRGPGRL